MLSRIVNKWRLLFKSDPKKIFTRIYTNNEWGSKESVSGPGSTLSATESLRNELPQLFRTLGIKSIVDAPCGDFHWMSQVDFDTIQYTGADVVDEIIVKNLEKFHGKNFIVCDVIDELLPKADLVLCRDLFIHLKNSEIKKVISNFKSAGFKFMLASTYPVKTNTQILTGHFRPVNLQIAPFNLPMPIGIIKDPAADGTPRMLGLWEMEKITI